MVAKGEVLTEDEAAEHIRSRHMEEIEQAQRKKQLWDRRENSRKTLICKLNFMTALDNSYRSAPCSEQAVSMWIEAVLDIWMRMNRNLQKSCVFPGLAFSPGALTSRVLLRSALAPWHD